MRGLIESYCNSCGLLIAASPKRGVLDLVEKIHTCPVYCNYGSVDHSPGKKPELSENGHQRTIDRNRPPRLR
jgi:hypothetical protein